jgi:hypothetical protein
VVDPQEALRLAKNEAGEGMQISTIRRSITMARSPDVYTK